MTNIDPWLRAHGPEPDLSPNTKSLYPAAQAEWLDSMSWDLWFTMTYPEMRSRSAVRRSAIRLRGLVSPGPSCLYFGTEIGPISGKEHAHGLAKFPVSLTEKGVAMAAYNLWRAARRASAGGRCDVKPFEAEKGISHYVAKYCTKALADWDLLTAGSENLDDGQFRDGDPLFVPRPFRLLEEPHPKTPLPEWIRSRLQS